MTYYYTHRVVYFSALIRQVFFCNRWQLTQGPIMGRGSGNETTECSTLNGSCNHTYLLPGLRDHFRRGTEILYEPEVVDDSKGKNDFRRQQSSCTNELTATVTQELLKLRSGRSLGWRGMWAQSLPVTEAGKDRMY